MNATARSLQGSDILEQTASRLIDALGLQGAIFVCRSNYWHGILRIVLRRQTAADGIASSALYDCAA
ncbi:MAG: hypothetical protein HC871_10025 [Rhizobiales bacterium]|nr:hypothetical protein [Hyphomicrobiales bacterium]